MQRRIENDTSYSLEGDDTRNSNAEAVDSASLSALLYLHVHGYQV